MNGEMPSKPVPEPSAKVLRRMWSKIKQEGDCWLWTGATNWEYGSTSIDTGDFRAHRLFFSWFKYDIPKGLTIDHLCKNRRCVNPDHLEDVTQKENIHRALKRPYCKNGHAQIPENRYRYKNGRERCRPCLKLKSAKARADRRARGLKKPGRKKEMR